MGKLAELIDEVADLKNSLNSILLKAKVLSFQFRGRKFREWISSEINGYDRNQTLPEYRRVTAHIYGDYGGFGGAYQNAVPISVEHLPDDMRDVFQRYSVWNG